MYDFFLLFLFFFFLRSVSIKLPTRTNRVVSISWETCACLWLWSASIRERRLFNWVMVRCIDSREIFVQLSELLMITYLTQEIFHRFSVRQNGLSELTVQGPSIRDLESFEKRSQVLSLSGTKLFCQWCCWDSKEYAFVIPILNIFSRTLKTLNSPWVLLRLWETSQIELDVFTTSYVRSNTESNSNSYPSLTWLPVGFIKSPTSFDVKARNVRVPRIRNGAIWYLCSSAS